MFHKFSKYQLELHSLDQDFGATKTKSNGRIFDSGLVRNGFAKTGKVPYQFDTVSMLYIGAFQTELMELHRALE